MVPQVREVGEVGEVGQKEKVKLVTTGAPFGVISWTSYSHKWTWPYTGP